MTNLTVHLGDKNIGLVLPEVTISIAIQNNLAQQLAEPAKTAQLEWSDTLLNGESVNYEAAEKAVAALGPSWRLPTVNELFSIVDRSRHDPAIDTSKFPDTKSKAYWTSEECDWDSSAVWIVYFYGGDVGYLHRSYGGCVRAVRSSQ